MTLNSGTPGMYMKKNRDGTYIIGFGKTPDGAGKSGIDVAGDIYINGRSLLDKMYPVGSIYISTAETNPKDLFGGTWEEYAKGRVIMGVGDNEKTNYTAGQTGGQDVITNTHNHYLLSSFDGTGFYMSSSGNAPRSRTKTVSRAHISPDTTGSGTTREDSTYNETLTLDVRQPYIACFIWRRTA